MFTYCLWLHLCSNNRVVATKTVWPSKLKIIYYTEEICWPLAYPDTPYRGSVVMRNFSNVKCGVFEWTKTWKLDGISESRWSALYFVGLTSLSDSTSQRKGGNKWSKLRLVFYSTKQFLQTEIFCVPPPLFINWNPNFQC